VNFAQKLAIIAEKIQQPSCRFFICASSRKVTTRNLANLHFHNSWEIKAVFKGSACCRFPFHRQYLRPGDISLIAPLTPHYSTLAADLTANSLLFDCGFENGEVGLSLTDRKHHANYFFSTEEKLCLSSFISSSVNDMCNSCLVPFRGPAEQYTSVVGIAFLKFLFACLSRAIGQHVVHDRSQQLAGQVSSFINSRYWDPGMTAHTIAKAMGISPGYLSFLFHRKTGIPLRQQIIRVRLEHAYNMIRQQKFSVKEIAHFAGWKNQHYFSNSFKKKYGFSPVQAKLITTA